ncbi:hypothetical protein CPE01_26820 [Cellulomonas persica]|uniref:Uncharacterized protein n=1 Tax=Cellulomonas persica TaxID=76861 RepID=A0A510UWM2_9CELL|nr:hypothetical protein CPE01_26820 [Cellulomonas persica]
MNTIDPTDPSIGTRFDRTPLTPSDGWISGGGCITTWPVGTGGGPACTFRSATIDMGLPAARRVPVFDRRRNATGKPGDPDP